MTKPLDFSVDAGRFDFLIPVRDPEMGTFEGHCLGYAHGVELRTRFGHSYTHVHQFADTPKGLEAAHRLARRVEAFVRVKGVAGLNLAHWNVRTIYGSDAYLDEEPEIVQREEDDALLMMGGY